MDVSTHLFIGVVAASAWPGLDTEQQIITVLFSILPDTFEWLHQYARKRKNGNHHPTKDDYNVLADKIGGLYLLPYNFFHNLFTPTIFLILSHIYNWPLVYSLMWLTHLLLDLPSHRFKLGLKLFWPFSQKRFRGFFDWWLVKFFRGWDIWGYTAILAIISTILIRKFW